MLLTVNPTKQRTNKDEDKTFAVRWRFVGVIHCLRLLTLAVLCAVGKPHDPVMLTQLFMEKSNNVLAFKFSKVEENSLLVSIYTHISLLLFQIYYASIFHRYKHSV